MHDVISTSLVIFKSPEVAMREELGAPAGSAMVEADGARIAVARWGSGPPLVCLHATGHGARDFEALARRLGDRFEIFALDWPGQGRSGDDPKPASAARYAELLEIVLRKLGVADPILLGNSIGGAAAMIYAARASVRGLVLCDPGGLVAVDAEVGRFIGLFVRFFRAGARRAWWFRPLFALYYGLVLPSPAARDQRRRIVVAAYDIAPVLVQSWTSFAQADADIRALAAGLDVPVWFAWARNDKVIPLSRCRPAISAMTRASISEFDAGHAAFLEQPEAFVEGFEAFVATLPAPVPAKVAG
jgi:4,5:9,10-diseco-3-hydroxy-5,9,17-trioxoandrosta-1(10),2-diene-4-oate hydrolase